jgi:methyltransferase family protein
MNGPDRPPPSFGVIDEVNTLDLKVTVLKTAMELDVFTTIASGHQHLEEIAHATCSSVRGMRVLLDALCPLGLLSKSRDLYALTPTAETYLVRTEPSCCSARHCLLWHTKERKLSMAQNTSQMAYTAYRCLICNAQGKYFLPSF